MTPTEVLQFIRLICYDYVLLTVRGVDLTLMDLVSSLLVVAVSLWLSKYLQGLLKRRFFPRFNLDPGLEFVCLRVTHFSVLAFGVYTSLSMLNIPLGVLVGFFTLLGVGIGFGLQNMASNFISGVILLFERPVKIGDRITVEDVWGDVKQINLRTTVVNTPDNVSIIIPNSSLLDNNLINWSYGDRRIRLRVPVGVAYGSDVDRVTELLIGVARGSNLILSSPSPSVHFVEFGDSSLNFELICWLADASIKPDAVNELNRGIDKIFRENDVEIPFPQRDLHLRSAEADLRVIKGA